MVAPWRGFFGRHGPEQELNIAIEPPRVLPEKPRTPPRRTHVIPCRAVLMVAIEKASTCNPGRLVPIFIPRDALS